MIKVLVTGAKGQLGLCLRDQIQNSPDIACVFASRETLDITNMAQIETLFTKNNFDYCINTAAYTNVDKAESEQQRSFLINADGAANISEACKKHQVTHIHISTDYVFDGTKKSPYVETDPTNPINVYGASKLKGEQHVREVVATHFILRTSWLYSQYGHNFFNSMLRFAKEKKKLTITTEQMGTPTNANDLAKAIVGIIVSKNTSYGTYHFSNRGAATWYDFAKAIFEITGEIDHLSLAKTDHYPTFAERPEYSVMDCTKVTTNTPVAITDWRTSLKNLIERKLI